MHITQLPDYPALEQLARALWRQGTSRGAAALIGAGFSKFANRAGVDTPVPPVWREFAHDMATQLYPDHPSDAPCDALRLAEEYRAYFGQAALDEFVHIRIRDAAWQPGQLHRSLLELPWSDVLTTNWDTLLERTEPEDIHFAYECIACEADLAHAHAPGLPRRPRVVKLHGSIGTTEHFVVAEEDYRTYPIRYAAFVNLARQVFIENELCLLGFSGDDPNFSQWSGWVRDNLGENARRIYLVGALGLGAPKRKLLELRNVAPIDLSPLVARLPREERHKAAMCIFLDFLAGRRPKSKVGWSPTPLSQYHFLPNALLDRQRQAQDVAYAASILDQCATVWIADRHAYPHWLVCPADARQQLRFSTAVVRRDLPTLEALPPQRKREVIYELSWRHTVGLWPIDDHLASALAEIATPAEPQNLTKSQCLEAAALLLVTARQSRNTEAFRRWASIIRANVGSEPNFLAEVDYQEALYARDELDLEIAKQRTRAIVGKDPIWQVRQAALLAELGEYKDANRLVEDALTALESLQRGDPSSLWIRSRRAWARWFAGGIRQSQSLVGQDLSWLLEFKEVRSDPKKEIDQLRQAAVGAVLKRQEDRERISPLFQAGHYRDSSSSTHFTTGAILAPVGELVSLLETSGLPIRFNVVSFAGDVALDSVELGFAPSLEWYCMLLRCLRGIHDKQFERYFGRVAIARLPKSVTHELSRKALAAVSYWRGMARKARGSSGNDFGSFIDKLRLWVEVLARLAVCQEPSYVQEHLALAAELASDLEIAHRWLNEPLDHLVDYTIEAIPPSERGSFVLTLLEFPMSSDVQADPAGWPRPLRALQNIKPDRSLDEGRWKRCIAKLIGAVGAGTRQRAEAAGRLAYLVQHQVLHPDETAAFALKLWESEDPQSKLPAGTDLSAFTFAYLPAPPEVDSMHLVRSWLFDSDVEDLLAVAVPVSSKVIDDKLNHLVAICGSAETDLRPTATQAARMFDKAAALRPAAPDSGDTFSAVVLGQWREYARRYLGEAIARVIVPSLALEDRTTGRLDALLGLIQEADVCVAVGALPYFGFRNDDAVEKITKEIHRAIFSRNEEAVAGGAGAIESWVTLAQASVGPSLPQALIDRVLSALESGRRIALVPILHCIATLVTKRALSSADSARATAALEMLRSEWDYHAIEDDRERSVSVSLVRAACVRLASAIDTAGAADQATSAWLDAASRDPLPEVRFALDEGQSWV